ncbi:MAG: Response regulatory protein [Candidatus Brocadiaceae bacterium]|nr:Response regulatory protein [Candidatus Brocadiaceae bacterium]
MNKCILIVDDSPLVVEVVSKFLAGQGYRIFTASNGIEAIEKTFRELPDLILLDVMMPRMNGYQACRLLKADPETCNIPIIMLTVKDQASDKYWGIQTGADAYLSKDSVQSTLLKTMDELLVKKERVALPHSLIRESSSLNAIDVVSKVNDLLDKKLFEATVLYEMCTLVEKGIDDFPGIVEVVIGMLSKILEFKVAAIIVKEEHNVECFFKPNHPVSKEYLRKFREYINKYLTEYGIDLSSDELTTILDKEMIKDAVDVNEQQISYFVVPIKYADNLGGVIILAQSDVDKIPSKEEGFFRTVIKEGYVIIQNAWLYSRIRNLAITDSLTGIYNRGFFYAGLCKEFARTSRLNLPLTFLLLDIDFFKKINDTFGHLQGDDVLRKVAMILKKNIRVYDALGRYGGEEFSIILPEAKLRDGCGLADRIRREIEKFNFGTENKALKCTISIGVSSCPDAEIKTIEDLVRKADNALYKAKAEGRNRVCSL